MLFPLLVLKRKSRWQVGWEMCNNILGICMCTYARSRRQDTQIYRSILEGSDGIIFRTSIRMIRREKLTQPTFIWIIWKFFLRTSVEHRCRQLLLRAYHPLCMWHSYFIAGFDEVRLVVSLAPSWSRGDQSRTLLAHRIYTQIVIVSRRSWTWFTLWDCFKNDLTNP